MKQEDSEADCGGLSTSPQVLSEFRRVVWRSRDLTQLTSSRDMELIGRALSANIEGDRQKKGGGRKIVQMEPGRRGNREAWREKEEPNERDSWRTRTSE